jgi:hypothetical protein
MTVSFHCLFSPFADHPAINSILFSKLQINQDQRDRFVQGTHLKKYDLQLLAYCNAEQACYFYCDESRVSLIWPNLKGRSSLCKYWHTCFRKAKTTVRRNCLTTKLSCRDATDDCISCLSLPIVFRVCLCLESPERAWGFTSGRSGSIL